MHSSRKQEISYQKKRKLHQNGEKEFPIVAANLDREKWGKWWHGGVMLVDLKYKTTIMNVVWNRLK